MWSIMKIICFRFGGVHNKTKKWCFDYILNDAAEKTSKQEIHCDLTIFPDYISQK